MSFSQTEGRHAGEFLVSEANGGRSREQSVLNSGGPFEAGTVLESMGAGYIAVATAANADAVLMYAADASAAAVDIVIVARDAEVNENEINYNGATKSDVDNALAAAGIIVRAAV